MRVSGVFVAVVIAVVILLLFDTVLDMFLLLPIIGILVTFVALNTCCWRGLSMIFVSSTNIFGILDDRKIASNANIWTKMKIRRCFWILLFDGIMVENGDEKEEGTKNSFVE